MVRPPVQNGQGDSGHRVFRRISGAHSALRREPTGSPFRVTDGGHVFSTHKFRTIGRTCPASTPFRAGGRCSGSMRTRGSPLWEGCFPGRAWVSCQEPSTLSEATRACPDSGGGRSTRTSKSTLLAGIDQCCYRPWLSRKGSALWTAGAEGVFPVGLAGGPSGGPLQAPAAAIRCRWSFKRLWVAAANRHSERTAALPRRWNRSNRRLYLTCPNTGSTVAMRRR
jgi:hypothetical protein